MTREHPVQTNKLQTHRLGTIRFVISSENDATHRTRVLIASEWVYLDGVLLPPARRDATIEPQSQSAAGCKQSTHHPPHTHTHNQLITQLFGHNRLFISAARWRRATTARCEQQTPSAAKQPQSCGCLFVRRGLLLTCACVVCASECFCEHTGKHVLNYALRCSSSPAPRSKPASSEHINYSTICSRYLPVISTHTHI